MRTVTRILFVCLGNICRSPAAEGVFRHMVAGEGLTTRFAVESAGTGAWHEGQPADRRMRRAAGRRGITLDSVARQITADDFQRFDHIFAMDSANLRTLQSLAPPEHRDKIRLFRDADPDGPGDDVPDPYYGGADGFDEVLDIVTRTGRVWLDTLRAR